MNPFDKLALTYARVNQGFGDCGEMDKGATAAIDFRRALSKAHTRSGGLPFWIQCKQEKRAVVPWKARSSSISGDVKKYGSVTKEYGGCYGASGGRASTGTNQGR